MAKDQSNVIIFFLTESLFHINIKLLEVLIIKFIVFQNL